MNLANNWEVITFEEAFQYCPKVKHKAGEGLQSGKYRFFTSSPTQSKYLDKYEFDGEYLVVGTGGEPSIHYCNGAFATSTDCFVLKSIKKDIHTKFVYYFLKGNISILKRGFRGAGLKHLSRNYLSKIQLPKPSLEIQKKIVLILEKAENSRELRVKANSLIENLLKSIYLDMFTSSESVEWEETQIKELALQQKGSMRTGPFGSNLKHGEFVNKGIAVLGIDNAVNNYFSWKERRFITQEKYQELKQYRVFPRDVIITIMATIGRSAVIPGDIPIAINTKHLAAITVDEEKVNPYFLSYSIHSNPYILHQLKLHNQGAIMDGLNLGIIKELKMKLPPIKLQNEFEKKYHKLRTMEKLGTEVLVELDNLSNILIQKAFSGELIC